MTGMSLGDELIEQMKAYERVSQFNTQCLLKENEFERTELVSDADGMCYIRKYLDVDEGRIHPYERLVGVDAPFIPKVISTSRIADKLVVVCEYVAGTSLEQLAKEQGPVSDDLTRTFMSCLADALSFLHAFDGGPIIHRDVNPSNIIVNTQGAWLIDLGIARAYDKGAQQDTHLWGTAGYAAPEQFGFGQTDARSDVYALGKVLLFMLTGHADARPDELASLHARHVVKTATALDPRQRYGSVQLMKADYLGIHQLNTPAAREARKPLFDGLLLAWRIVGTLLMVLLTVGFFISASKNPLPAYVTVNVVIWLFFCAVPWFVTTNMFGVLERISWFGGRRWLSALVIVAASVVVLFVFSAVWMAAGLPWPPSTSAA